MPQLAPFCSYQEPAVPLDLHRRRVILDWSTKESRHSVRPRRWQHDNVWAASHVITITGDAPSTHEIERRLADSRRILELHDNWDGEDAPGYLESTWLRVADFLRQLARSSESLLGAVIPSPTIAPADKGSIDLFWQNGTRDLLINVPADGAEPITFYGHTPTGDSIQGATSAKAFRPDLAAWLSTP